MSVRAVLASPVTEHGREQLLGYFWERRTLVDNRYPPPQTPAPKLDCYHAVRMCKGHGVGNEFIEGLNNEVGVQR